MEKEPASLEATTSYLQQAKGLDPDLDRHLEQLYQSITTPGDHAFHARILVENLALAIQAIELIRIAPPAVAKLFCASRLSSKRHLTWGALENDQGLDEVINRVH